MFKSSRQEYSVKTCPADDVFGLEDLLNSMSVAGWELYTMHETDAPKGGTQYNCIFTREIEESEEEEKDLVELSSFQTKMEKMMKSGEAITEFQDIQQNIRQKKDEISKIKAHLDSEDSEFQRHNLNEKISEALKELSDLKNKLSNIISPERMYEKLGQNKIEIVLSDELLNLANSDNQEGLITQTIILRQKLAETYGYVIPSIKFSEDDAVPANEYNIKIRGINTFVGHVYPDYLMFYPEEAGLERKPKDAIEDLDAVTGKKVYWIKKDKTKDFWVKGLNDAEVIAKNLEYIVFRYVDEILDYNDVNSYVEIVGSQNLYLIENIIPDFLSVADLRYLFASLIREKVSLKDITYIFEKINDFADDAVKENLLEKVRISLGRSICQNIADKDKNLYYLTLDNTFCEKIKKGLKKENVVIKVKEKLVKSALKQIYKAIKDAETDTTKVAMVVPLEIRQIVFMIFEQVIPDFTVLAPEEITNDYNAVELAKIEI